MTQPATLSERQCVMVIDDDNTVRATLQAALEVKYRVISLSNSEEVAAHIESHGPKILILDINLPGSDGFEMCRKIRSKAKLSDLPILFMTSRKDDRAFLHGLGSGGNAVITKPFGISELRQKVEYLLKNYPYS